MAETKRVEEVKREFKTEIEALMKEEDHDCNMEVTDSEMAESSQDGLKMAEDLGKKEELETEIIKDGGDDNDDVTQTLLKGKSKLKQSDQQVESGQASNQDVSVQHTKDCLRKMDEENVEEMLKRLPCSHVRDEYRLIMDLQLYIRKTPSINDFFARDKWPINQLLNPTSIQRAYTHQTLHHEIVEILLLLSHHDSSTSMIVQQCSDTIPFLVSCCGRRIETRRIAVMALHNFSIESSNRKIMGESGAIALLMGNLEEGDQADLLCAAKAIWHLCNHNVENRVRAVSLGAVTAVMGKIRRRIHLDEMLILLDMLSRDNDRVIAEMEENGMLQDLFLIMREYMNERCVLLIYNMCRGSAEKTRKINEVENARQSLEIVAHNGSMMRAREKAKELLSWLG